MLPWERSDKSQTLRFRQRFTHIMDACLRLIRLHAWLHGTRDGLGGSAHIVMPAISRSPGELDRPTKGAMNKRDLSGVRLSSLREQTHYGDYKYHRDGAGDYPLTLAEVEMRARPRDLGREHQDLCSPHTCRPYVVPADPSRGKFYVRRWCSRARRWRWSWGRC
jgi:hypothetical protein